MAEMRSPRIPTQKDTRKNVFDNVYDIDRCDMSDDEIETYANVDKRYLMIEKNLDNREWYSTYDSVDEACDASATNILMMDGCWFPWYIVDLNTGAQRELRVGVSPNEEF